MSNTWTIDPTHTRVGFGVKHMMFTTVRGQFPAVEGSVTFDPDDIASSSVEVTIEAASIDTGVEARDEHLRSADFFDVESHPHITFRSTRVSGSSQIGGELRIEGELTIRGQSRDVVLTAALEGTGTDPWGGTRAGFTAKTKIDRRDFGLTWNQALEAGGVLVGNTIDIGLQVQAVLQEEAAAAV